MAINHVPATLDDELIADVKLLQLSVNNSLERLLELIEEKLQITKHVVFEFGESRRYQRYRENNKGRSIENTDSKRRLIICQS